CARDRAGDIHRRRDARIALRREAAVRRLEPHEAAIRRRNADAPHAVAAEAPARDPRGDGDRGPRARSAWKIAWSARVLGHRPGPPRAEAIPAELGHLGLARDEAARVAPALHDPRAARGDVASAPEAEPRARARDVDRVFDGDRLARERAFRARR